MENLATGFRGIEDKTTLLVFSSGSLLQEEVVHQIEKGHEAFAKEREAAAMLELATEERRRLTPSLKRLCSEAVVVAKRRYDDDPRKMGTFGVTRPASSTSSGGGTPRVRPRKRKPVCREAQLVEEVVTTVVEEVVVNDEPRVRRPSRPRATLAALLGLGHRLGSGLGPSLPGGPCARSAPLPAG